MTRKLIVLFSVFAMLCLIAAPAMANLIVQIQPLTINGGAVDHNLTSLTVNPGDVIAFQLVGNISGAGDSGVNAVKGSLVQKLATLISGTWNTEVMGNLSVVTLSAEFAYNYPTTSHGGVANQDVNADGFALDTGSTAASATNYILDEHTSITGHGVSGDVLGTFTYTVSAVDAVSQIPTSLNWLFGTNGAAAGKAAWTESGSSWNSSTSTNYTAGTPISLNVVPEPAVLILISMGALALLLFRRRQ